MINRRYYTLHKVRIGEGNRARRKKDAVHGKDQASASRCYIVQSSCIANYTPCQPPTQADSPGFPYKASTELPIFTSD